MSWFGQQVSVRRRFGAAATAVILTASSLGASAPGAAIATGGSPGAGQAGQAGSAGQAGRARPAGVPVKVLKPEARGHFRAANQASKPFRATATRWPSAASASAALPGARPGHGAGPMVRIAGTPLWVQSMGGVQATGAGQRVAAPSKVTATVLAHSRAAALGVSGLVFRLDAAEPAGPAGRVQVRLDYSSFAQAYGGNYGTRLRLAELPACALTTPKRVACRTQTPLRSIQNYQTDTVSAVLPLAVRGRGPVIAATSTTGQEGGAAGAYPPGKVSPAGTWSEGGDSGSFDYSYPITVPSARGGLTPSLTLSYDSQDVDGKIATTQAQSDWLGDGWTTPDSYISLLTTSCGDNPEGSASPTSTGDQCYDGEIVQMSLDGTSSPLVFVSSSTTNGVTTSTWKAQSDLGAVITHVSASSTVFGKYDSSKPGSDYWTVTNRDGTQYTFGQQHLPGFASGDASTNSVDWMPVYSAHSGDPCYNASGFTSSACPMAYQWHLDYVTDVHSDAMAYFYTQATNYYGEDNGASNVAYISDSYLDHIAYGFTDGNAYKNPPDLVNFSAKPRCTAVTCGPLATSNSSVSTQYPDVPVDLMCASGANCTAQSPALFSQVRLDSISIQQRSAGAGAYQNVDTYQFAQTEPASGDGLAATLWLDSITRTGQDAGGGGTATPVRLPSVSFGKVDLQNRVSTAAYPGLYRFRISSVTNETGGVSNVSYGNPDPCPSSYSSSSGPSVTSANTASCFPVEWTPPGNSTPVLDWFESYAVTKVVTGDTTGGALTQETGYSYGSAAWHYDDNLIVKPKYRTWGQFRGYSTVTTKTGQTIDNPQTETVTAYYQGLNGDTLPTGTASVVLKDSQGASHTDSDQLAGRALETTTYQGAGGPILSSAISSYWVSPATADMSPTQLPALKSGSLTVPDLTATMTGLAETWTRTALTDGGETGTWRDTETDNTYDAITTDPDFGLLTYTYSHTDPVNAAFDSCAQDKYAPANKSENLVGLVSYTETDQAACSNSAGTSYSSVPAGLNTLGAPATVTASQVTKATETFYNDKVDSTFSTTFPQPSPPVNADATMTRQASAGTPGSFTWQTMSRHVYDAYGRQIGSYDALGNETTTAYTDDSAGLTTGTQVKVPATTYAGSSGTVTTTHVTSETLDPARGLVLTATDQNGNVTTEQYDELGRLTAVWKDGRATTSTPNITYAYTVSNTVTNGKTALSGVVAGNLNAEGNDVPSVTIYDSLGRVRQIQTLGTTPNGNGRLVADTLYDSRGWVSEASKNYYDSSSLPALTLFPTPLSSAPDVDEFTYDGNGRQVEDTSISIATAISTTVTVYNGDSTTVIPGVAAASVRTGAIPATAGTVQTTTTNPMGQTTSLTQYTANPTLNIPSNTTTGAFYLTNGSGTASTTSYTYDAMGNQVKETLGGATWTGQYNLLGLETQSTDATGGTTHLTYDADGHLIQTQDPSGNYVSVTYDQDGRKTAQYASQTGSANQHAYGTAGANQLASWVYDNANGAGSPTDAKGQATTVTSYAGGHAYVVQQAAFNAFGESKGETFTFDATAPGAGLGTSLTFLNTYEPINGGLTKQSYPAAGGLPAETVTYGTVGALDLPGVTGGNNGYAAAATYTAQSQPEQVTLGAGASEATVTYSYDPRTGAPTDRLVQRSTAIPKTVDETSYTYNPAGAQTSETDARLGSSSTAELQCFAYTTNGQLAQAWTAASSCSTAPSTTSFATVGDELGTSSEYDESWAYTALGQPHTETSLVPSAQAFATTTYSYSHSTELTAAATAGATTGSASYTYNANGQQLTRSPDGGQTLAWNNVGDLTGITATSGGAQAAAYVYDASGNLLTQTSGTKTTVYLPGEQLTIDTSASPAAVSGVRFYTLPGGITAVRTGAGASYGFELASDQHGTDTLYLDSTAQVPTWRQFDPYGNPRGTIPASGFPGRRGFLNDPVDASTGLTDVGARWYDSATGTFVSLDPVLDPASPLQLNGYTYAAGNPVGGSDPSGQHLCSDTCGGPGSGTAPGTGPNSPGGWQCGCGGGAPRPSSPPPSQAPPRHYAPPPGGFGGCGVFCIITALLAGTGSPVVNPGPASCGGMLCTGGISYNASTPEGGGGDGGGGGGRFNKFWKGLAKILRALGLAAGAYGVQIGQGDPTELPGITTERPAVEPNPDQQPGEGQGDSTGGDSSGIGSSGGGAKPSDLPVPPEIFIPVVPLGPGTFVVFGPDGEGIVISVPTPPVRPGDSHPPVEPPSSGGPPSSGNESRSSTGSGPPIELPQPFEPPTAINVPQFEPPTSIDLPQFEPPASIDLPQFEPPTELPPIFEW